MTTRIDITAPATVTVSGSTVSSLSILPPGGLSILDPANGAIAVTLSAQNAAAAFSASSAGGANVARNANTITITGSQAQVNAALASLAITEPANASADTILLTVTDPSALPAQTDIAVNPGSHSGPAFAAPPATLALPSYSVSSLAGLILGDPAADALNAAGLGRTETMSLTLSAASGVLLLPGLSPLSGIQASGIGTPQIQLTFTADQIPAVNALLAGLDDAAPAATSGLAYILHNISGPMGAGSTSGNITLHITGTQGPPATITTGADTAILGPASFSQGSTLNIAGITTDIGGITGGGALFIHPDAAFEVPYNTLSLSGTSLDFGTLGAASLSESSALIIAYGASFGGPVTLGPGGLIDFAGTLITAADAKTFGAPGLSLAAGALLTGAGALVAGNFSESGIISGPGTIQVNSGETLLIAAGSISGSHINIAPGGVLELGPLDPLYGVFNATPLTVAPSVTLAFQGSGGSAITGGFADTLAQSGGVIVIESPDIFNGTITNFAPGDRLIFPTLSGLALLSITSHSFVVAGIDSNNVTQSYSFNTTYAQGAQLFVSLDAAGDSAVSLRDTLATDVFLNGMTASSAQIAAAPGIAQPVPGLDLLLRSWTTQSLSLTLAAASGVLSDDSLGPASHLTLTAASPAALDAMLADLVYTFNPGAVSDHLDLSSGSGILSGITASIPVSFSAGGTVSGFGNAGQAALFAGNGIASPLGGAAAPGEILVTGTAVFSDHLIVDGLSGTSLRIAPGGTGIFDAGANVSLGANAIIGDASGPGQLDIISRNFFSAGNLTLAGGSNAGITGALYLDGSLSVNSGTLELAGNLAAGSASLGTAGTITATGAASANFGALTNAGRFSLSDAAHASAASLALNGTMSLGGLSAFSAQTGAAVAGGLTIGPDAVFTAVTLDQTGGNILLGGTLSLAGALISSAALTLGGGTLIAPSITLDAGAALSGAGIVEGAGGLGVIHAPGGTILATGALVLGDDISLSNNTAITIGVSAALDIVHAASGGTVGFAGANAELTINDVTQFSLGVAGMLDHDVIDLIGIAPSLVSFANGNIAVSDAAARPLGGFALSIASGQPPLQIVSDNHGGALITLGGDMPCFARGTRLLTPNGYRPVESFSPGDPVITLGGVRRAVRWIGRRTVDPGCQADACPVRFAPHALGPGMPARAVRLSPLHAVFFNGVLVPALHLVNGATITAHEKTPVTYYHIELDRHGVVLADGLPAETYLDNGNRGQLYHETGQRGTCRTPCARLVTSGPQLAAIRRKLHNIALQAGYTLTYAPALRGIAGRKSLLPEIRMQAGRRLARFALPGSPPKLTLAAHSATPADTDPDSEDRRQLGICLHRIHAGGKTFPPASYLGKGWYARATGDAGLWMGGTGEILPPPGTKAITLSLAAIIQSWVPPIDFRKPGA